MAFFSAPFRFFFLYLGFYRFIPLLRVEWMAKVISSMFFYLHQCRRCFRSKCIEIEVTNIHNPVSILLVVALPSLYALHIFISIAHMLGSLSCSAVQKTYCKFELIYIEIENQFRIHA